MRRGLYAVFPRRPDLALSACLSDRGDGGRGRAPRHHGREAGQAQALLHRERHHHGRQLQPGAGQSLAWTLAKSAGLMADADS